MPDRGGPGIGAAVAAEAARRQRVMECPTDKVEWEGPDSPCWVCGLHGVHKYTEQGHLKPTASVNLLHPKVDPVTTEED